MSPLKPFAPPPNLLAYLPATVSSHTIALWLLAAATVYWIIYTTIATYHWLRYSHNAAIATPAIATHVVISLILMGYAISGIV